MCNRYKLKSKPDELLTLFQLASKPPAIDKEYFPGKLVPVVTARHAGREIEARISWMTLRF